jgi:hypothetical protein
LVRFTHWLTTLAFLALLVTGLELVVSHPRFYWGEVGNVNTEPLFKIPIPASRSLVPTGYGYTLPDQNGWSRYLHFQSAWLLVLTGLLYVGVGLLRGHFRRELLPTRSDLSAKRLLASAHRAFAFEATRCGRGVVVQRAAAAGVSAHYFCGVSADNLDGAGDVSLVCVGVSGGGECFGRAAIGAHAALFADGALLLFLLIHILMVILAGFWSRCRAMITGRAAEKEGA